MRILAIFLVLCLSFSFVTATAESIPNDTIQSNKIIENTIDISKYTESKNYHVEKIIPTEYGTVLYFWPVGAPHGGKNPKLALIKDDGSEVTLSEAVSRLDFYHSPELENIRGMLRV